MVILYTGTPGSGKSYHATQLVHRATRRKVNVIANFVINLPPKQQPYFYFIDNKQLKVKTLIEFSKEHHKENKESQTIIIIDEAATIFNTRDSARKDRDSWIKFFSQHRKLGYDIILIAQNDRMLDRQIRANIEYHYIHRKLTNFGLKGFVIRCLLMKQFVCIHRWYGINEKVSCEYFRINRKVAASYDTFSLFDYSEKSNSSGGLISVADFNRMMKEGNSFEESTV